MKKRKIPGTKERERERGYIISGTNRAIVTHQAAAAAASVFPFLSIFISRQSPRRQSSAAAAALGKEEEEEEGREL